MTEIFTGGGRSAAALPNSPARQMGSPVTERLEISVERAGPITRLTLLGGLDSALAASAYDLIVACAAVPTRQLILDLNGLDTATRAGCRAIHVAAKLLHGRCDRMTIVGARPNVDLVLTGTGFDNLIDFVDGRAPSVAATSKVQRPEIRTALAWPSSERRAS